MNRFGSLFRDRDVYSGYMVLVVVVVVRVGSMPPIAKFGRSRP